jgi:hypothetical protein
MKIIHAIVTVAHVFYIGFLTLFNASLFYILCYSINIRFVFMPKLLVNDNSLTVCFIMAYISFIFIIVGKITNNIYWKDTFKFNKYKEDTHD